MSEAKQSRRGLKIALPLLILVIAVIGFSALNKLKRPPQRQLPPEIGVLVDVIELQAGAHQVKVQATGTVSPAQEIPLVPEVSGKVTWLSPQLVDGGLFKAGELLLKIDPRDYRLALEKSRAEVARAEVALRTEQERAEVAQQEWQRIDLLDKGQPGPLVVRELQLLQEQANLAAARANQQLARLNLQRTELKAPFNGRIRQEQVDLGQYLRAGTSIGTFAGTDRAEIRVPLPVDELQWLEIPPAGSSTPGSLALVSLPGNQQSPWQGRVVRSLGEIDPGSRMAMIVVAADDPYQLARTSERPDLANGLFVDIEIFGRQLDNVIRIPRAALHNDQQVWIADEDSHLRLRQVQVVRRERQQLLVSQGVSAGEKLVTTSLSAAAEGMLLRPVLQGQQQ